MPKCVRRIPSGSAFALRFKTVMMPETSSATDSADDPNSPFAPVYKVLADAIAAHAFPGCAFGVLAGGKVVLQDALGRFTYDDNSPAVTPETVYDVASITKVARHNRCCHAALPAGPARSGHPVG